MLYQLLGDISEDRSQVLRAVAMHLAKPGARNLLFRMFDGVWLRESPDRGHLAKRLLTLVVDFVVGGDSSDVQTELLAMLGSFQRHLLSTPMSSTRSTRESEELLLFYASHSMQCVKRLLGGVLDSGGKWEEGSAQSFVRVLFRTLTTALSDKQWTQNLSGGVSEGLHSTLKDLLELLDRINRADAEIRYQDASFSAGCTESRYIGGKIVSIPCTRSVKPCVVKMAGATSMVVRLSEDLVLGKRETLRIQSDRDGSSTSTIIKGGSRAHKNIWKSFGVHGDTVHITYGRSVGSTADDAKPTRHVRCAGKP
jgi:hypothetical protein